MKEFRQYRSNQGRSPRKMTDTYKILGYTAVIFVVSMIVSIITAAL
jgi:hypothetical protein